MKTRYLLPNGFKKIGWLLLIPSLILGILLLLNDIEYPSIELDVYSIVKDNFLLGKKSHIIENHNILIEVAIIVLIIGGLLVGFSREKVEDEYIYKIRMESLIWATYVNYIVLIIATLFIYGIPFLNVLIINMFTLLLFFIIRFNYLLFQFNKSTKNEK